MLNYQEAVLAECLFQLGLLYDGSFHKLSRLKKESWLTEWQMKWALLQLRREHFVEFQTRRPFKVRLTTDPKDLDVVEVLDSCQFAPETDGNGSGTSRR